MALTKLPKAGLATGSVSASQIEDGTIQNQEFEDSTLTNAKLADSTIANAKLSNSTFTLNGQSIALGASGTLFDGELVEWQSVVTTNTTMVAGRGYFVNTTGGEVTMTLPASATIGDTISIKDYAGNFGSNKVIIGRNGHNIQGVANNSDLSTNRASVTLVYVDATKGWLYTDEHNVASLQVANHIEATGGTVSTSGDYKIHVFNSTSNFVVSQTGNNPSNPAGGPNTVSYLVVAGGGGGSGPSTQGSGGSGNTPPVSPPQGQNGSAHTNSPDTYGGAGGGAGGAGQDSPDGNPASQGGAATPSSITGSAVTYAGGGGGGGGPAGPGGHGGGQPSGPARGGGGPGGNSGVGGNPGTANTGGGGGGGGGSGGAPGGSGGKGIVILRYKVQ